jgi:hypothetical protein
MSKAFLYYCPYLYALSKQMVPLLLWGGKAYDVCNTWTKVDNYSGENKIKND